LVDEIGKDEQNKIGIERAISIERELGSNLQKQIETQDCHVNHLTMSRLQNSFCEFGGKQLTAILFVLRATCKTNVLQVAL